MVLELDNVKFNGLTLFKVCVWVCGCVGVGMCICLFVCLGVCVCVSNFVLKNTWSFIQTTSFNSTVGAGSGTQFTYGRSFFSKREIDNVRVCVCAVVCVRVCCSCC